MFLVASHCVMRNTTFVLCNTKNENQVMFPIESQLRILSTFLDVYVFTIIVGCRNSIEPFLCRGVDAEKSEEVEDRKTRNIIMVFSCQPDRTSDVESTIVKDCFEQFKKHAKPYDGTLTLPGTFQTWIPGKAGKLGEVVALVTDRLVISHHKWVPRGSPRQNSAQLK